MTKQASIGLDRPQYEAFASAYFSRWQVHIYAIRTSGKVVFCPQQQGSNPATLCQEALVHAMHESLRWGAPTFYDKPHGYILWAVPLMHNAQLTGGLVACIEEQRVFPDESGTIAFDLRAAANDLLEMAQQHNLTNAACLRLQREAHAREQKRAEAIHDLKHIGAREALEMYLKEEPALVSAIRRGERREAVGILNRVLAAVYYYGNGRLDLIKSLLMELVVTMSRTAVEAGGAPDELLGGNFTALSQLSDIATEEELSAWVVNILKRMMDSIEHHNRLNTDNQLHDAVAFMKTHFAEPISRDQVADAVGLSPSALSRLFAEKSKHGFADTLNRIRVDHAAELLRRTDRSLLNIALDSGFSDQSYFTKVFRRFLHVTPNEYRKTKR